MVQPARPRSSPVSSDRRHQSSRTTGDAHDTKPLQFDRCLDQTLNEHEFPLRYVDSFTTSKYLIELMPVVSQGWWKIGELA